MKIFLALFALLYFGSISSAQVNIRTRKERISDFQVKTTKIVLAGNEMFNQYFKEEIARRWVVSSYEFCTEEEYADLKESPEFYFLLPVTSRQKKEVAPGIAELCLFKGGKADSDNEPVEIVSIPYASSEDSNGREFVFLPAIIDIIQSFTLEALESDKTLLGGLGLFTVGKGKVNRDALIFSDKDLAPSLLKDEKWASKGISIVSTDEADSIITERNDDVLVSYVIAPSSPYKGSVCFKMLINARDHRLCYYSKHTISPSAGVGFLPKDFRTFLSGRR